MSWVEFSSKFNKRNGPIIRDSTVTSTFPKFPSSYDSTLYRVYEFNHNHGIFFINSAALYCVT